MDMAETHPAPTLHEILKSTSTTNDTRWISTWKSPTKFSEMKEDRRPNSINLSPKRGISFKTNKSTALNWNCYSDDNDLLHHNTEYGVIFGA
jgi:hypothetical protein